MVAVGLVVIAGAAAFTVWGPWSDEPADRAAPSPLFGDVEALALTTLPDGWARCGGGPSDRPEAESTWWAQTFGPVVDGGCEPLITVTQIPTGKPRLPKGRTNGGIGEEPGRTGAQHWSDEGEGSRGLYTSLSGQKLVVEACCGPEATDDAVFLLVANAARDGSREVEPARCSNPASDLSQESFLDNFFGRHDRVHDEEGCPIRSDLITWKTEPATAHCFAGVTFLVIGTPVGATIEAGTARLFVRDEQGELGMEPAIPEPDLDAELPPDAKSTGWSQGGRTLWVDETDDEWVYLVGDDSTEAWPRDRRMHACA